MTRKLLFFIFIFILISSITVISISKPTKSNEDKNITWVHLFHISRSINKNIVIYEVGISSPTEPGEKPKFITNNPIKVYWRLYAKQGEIQELTAIEEKLGYGINISTSNSDQVVFYVKPLPKKLIRVEFVKENGSYIPKPITNINNEDCYITEIFIQAKKSFPLPKVIFIDIKGVSIKTNQIVTEHIVNK